MENVSFNRIFQGSDEILYTQMYDHIFFPFVYMIIYDLIGCQSCEEIISVFIVP